MFNKIWLTHCRYFLRKSGERCVFACYAEIQDGRQKWRENDFCDNLPVNSAHTLYIKTFVEIALARSVSEINAFFTEIQDGHQKWRENKFVKTCQQTLVIPCGSNISSKLL